MDPTSAINAIVAAPGLASARSAFRAARGEAGLGREFFARILSAFGSDASEARRLAAYWRLMLAYADEPALAYRAKGVHDRLQGRWLESARAFVKAGELAATDAERLSFQMGAVDSFARAGRIAQAIALAGRLAGGLDTLGEERQAARVRLNAGNALLWADRYREASRWLKMAIPHLDEQESVYAALGLSTAELYGGDPREAHRIAEEARESARRLGLDYASSLAGLNIAQSALLQGRADEALAQLLSLRGELSRCGSNSDQARVSEFLGDAYLRLNLWSEAVDAYEEAISGRRLPALNVAASSFGLGQARMALGEIPDALRSLRRAASTFRRAGNPAWEAAATTKIAEADRLQNRPALAKTRLLRAAKGAADVRSRWHEAEALLTLAEAEVDLGGVPDLRRARLLIRTNGFVSLRWRLDAIRARSTGRLRDHRAAFLAILDARALAASASSRMAYLRDKSDPISAYLAALLQTPTPSHVVEAIDVVARSRSAALLDEILSSGAGALDDEQIARIETLRSELQSLESEGDLPGAERRAPPSPAAIAGLRRRWLEASHFLLPAPSQSKIPARAVVVARAGEELYALRGPRAVKFRISASDLERTMPWLRFELLAPMVDRAADPQTALAMIGDLAEKALASWFDETTLAITPEDSLWQIPWVACAASLGGTREPVLAMHPSLVSARNVGLPDSPSAMLWIDEKANLYHAEEERASFIRRFPQGRVCRTLGEVRDSLDDQVDLLHVICHARHNPQNPMFSAMIFGKEALYATEIARSRLRPLLVTLSACDTGNVTAAFRHEPDGLARAFLARGAKSVVGSLWPLDDEAAFRTYTHLFGSLGESVPLLEAMNLARRSVRKWNPHPYYWAPLAVFGGYER